LDFGWVLPLYLLHLTVAAASLTGGGGSRLPGSEVGETLRFCVRGAVRRRRRRRLLSVAAFTVRWTTGRHLTEWNLTG